MRKIAIILFLLLTLISCSKKKAETFNVIAVNFPSYDAARAIMGEENLTMLLPPAVDVHNYEVSAREAARIAEADLVIYTGGESDYWVEGVLSSLSKDIKVFKLMDQTEILAEEIVLGMEGEAEDEDEHVWTSPLNEIRIVNNLASLLISLNPEKKEEYERNRENRVNELLALDSEIRDIVSSSSKDTLLFASRFPFLYFVKEYGLNYFAAFPGCSEETEPSAKTIAFLIDKAKELEIPVLYIELSSLSIPRTIAEEAGVDMYQFSSVHTLTKDEYIGGEDYVSIMKKNVEVLREALK